MGRGIHAEPLFDEPTVLVAREGHPECARRLSRRRLGSLRHVGVEMAPGRGFRDPLAVAYARARTERTVTVTVPTFTAAAAIAAATDLVATLPASLFAALGARQGLRAVEGPVPVHTVKLSLCWHERTHTDPAMSAFRALVGRAILGMKSPTEPAASRGGRPPRAVTPRSFPRFHAIGARKTE